MRMTLIIVYAIVMGIAGLSSWAFGNTLYKVHDLDTLFQYEKSMGIPDGKGIYVYVFNDKTQLWDRAREETLKNATCDKLHTYVKGEE